MMDFRGRCQPEISRRLRRRCVPRDLACGADSDSLLNRVTHNDRLALELRTSDETDREKECVEVGVEDDGLGVGASWSLTMRGVDAAGKGGMTEAVAVLRERKRARGEFRSKRGGRDVRLSLSDYDLELNATKHR